MDLRTFKSGVDYISKATNQRQAEPEPFLVQVSADSSLSLVSGDGETTYIWRTGEKAKGGRQRFGIPSKMLVQATKALKGSKVSVGMSVTNGGMSVSTSSGGAVNLPSCDGPELSTPFMRAPTDPVMSLRKGTLSRWSDAFTTALSPTEDSTQFDIDGRVSATDGYIMFDTHGTLDTALPEPKWVRASFWNALRGATGDATLTFTGSGLSVRSEQFEALSNYLGAQRVLPDMKQYYYPDGVVPPVYVVVDRKLFIGQVKAVASTTKKEQIFMSLPLKENHLVIKGIQTGANIVMNIKKRSKGRDDGTGTIECNAKYLVDICNAIDGKDIIISWLENATHPLGIRDTAQQHEWFLLAPVVRT